jgi:hypothetical protein
MTNFQDKTQNPAKFVHFQKFLFLLEFDCKNTYDILGQL